MADEITAEEAIVETDETTVGEGADQTPEKEVTSQPEVEESVKEETTEETIPVRPTASYIIERKNRQIEKLRSKLNDDVDKTEEPADPIAERLDRIEEVFMGQAEERELNAFFEKEPDARKYEKTIKAYMQHDAYKASSPEVIYHHVAWKDAQAQTDSKRKAADLEARQTRSAGSSVRNTRSSSKKTAEDIKNMTPEEFKEYDREQERLARS